MPYAAKATVEHEFVTDHLEIYVTFRHPMKLSSEPLTVPPVWDIMPPLNKWLLDADAVDVDIVSSVWLDLWTLLLTSDTIATHPALVNLEYDGPDIGLRTSWNKQWEPFGPIPSEELVTNVLANMYPQRATMWHDEATIVVGSVNDSWTIPDQKYGLLAWQSVPLNGDSFSQSFSLKAGTYLFEVLGYSDFYRACVDWYIDNVLVITGQDWYTDSPTFNVIKSDSGVVITKNGYHKITGIVNGKNANAQAYSLALTKYWLKPSVDPERI